MLVGKAARSSHKDQAAGSKRRRSGDPNAGTPLYRRELADVADEIAAIGIGEKLDFKAVAHHGHRQRAAITLACATILLLRPVDQLGLDGRNTGHRLGQPPAEAAVA